MNPTTNNIPSYTYNTSPYNNKSNNIPQKQNVYPMSNSPLPNLYTQPNSYTQSQNTPLLPYHEYIKMQKQPQSQQADMSTQTKNNKLHNNAINVINVNRQSSSSKQYYNSLYNNQHQSNIPQNYYYPPTNQYPSPLTIPNYFGNPQPQSQYPSPLISSQQQLISNQFYQPQSNPIVAQKPQSQIQPVNSYKSQQYLQSPRKFNDNKKDNIYSSPIKHDKIDYGQQQYNGNRDRNLTNNNNKKFYHNNNNSYKSNKYQQKTPFQRQQDHEQYVSEIDINSQKWSDNQEDQQDEQFIYQRYSSRQDYGKRYNNPGINSNTNTYYNKNKPIKKKDPVLDAPQQIRKWVQARKKRYPGLKKLKAQQQQKQLDQEASHMMNQKQKKEMSKLEMKIRKKIVILNGDSRSMLKKIRNIELLKRIVQDPSKMLKKERKVQPRTQERSSRTTYRNNSIQQEVQKVSSLQVKEEHSKKQYRPSIKQPIIPMRQEQINDNSSVSQESIQPQEVPINKLPKVQTHIQQEQKDIQFQEQEPLKPAIQLFQVIQKEIDPISIPKQLFQQRQKQNNYQKNQKSFNHNNRDNSRNNHQNNANNSKPLDPQLIIAHLKQKQQQDKQSLNTLFDYKSNSHSYRYRVQTLQTSLKLDDIFKETTYLLQAIRYMVKENFFEKKKQE